MKIINRFLESVCCLFAVLAILCIPNTLFPYHEKIIRFVFLRSIKFIKPSLFSEHRYEELSSDSSSLYTLVFILFLIALTVTVIGLHKKTRVIISTIRELTRLVISYYLAIVLLNYGFEKVMMQQFYAPESNILHTPFGYLDKDILFWSTIGSSITYNLFIGGTQIIVALCLLFRNTRFFGYISAVVLFVNIVAINFCYDISVKLLSLLLLFISLLGLSFYKTIIVNIFKSINIKKIQRYPFLYAFSKAIFILFFIFKIVYVCFEKTENTQILLGGYETSKILKNDFQISCNDPLYIKRIFFHKKGFVIFQGVRDIMKDYKIDFITNKKQFVITDYDDREILINYLQIGTKLILNYKNDSVVYKIELLKINEDLLPVNQFQFHWTVDQVK